jgi:hypothetical protein
MCVPCLIGIAAAFVLGLVFLGFRRLRIVGVVLVCLAVGTSCYAFWQARRYERNLPLVQSGDSPQRVRALLGRPWDVTDGTKYAYGLPRASHEIRTDVAQEYWYYCMYAPAAYAVSFGHDGKVVRAYRLVSR